jgi:septal ring factor EnvC (AmiA/AmiB activator)
MNPHFPSAPRIALALCLCILAPSCGRDQESQRLSEEWRLKEQSLKEQLAAAREELRLEESRIRESKLKEVAELHTKTTEALEDTKATRDTLKKDIDTILRQLKESEP